MNTELKERLINGAIQIKDLSKEEFLSVGFRKWDEESGILLIPLWAYELFPDGTELTSIFGDKEIKGKDEIDLDTRGGFISYGIKI